MEGVRLILNDETVVENGRAGYASGSLWLRLPGLTMQDAAMIAFDHNKTERIVFQYGEMEDVYEAYTNCTGILAEEGQISVCMVRGTD